MSFKDVLDFTSENPVCFISTIDGDQPRVRGFLTVSFNDGKFYFTTASTKNVYKNLVKNKKIELCYCSRDYSKMLRITGEIEIIDDREKKQKLLNERDYLKSFGGKADDPRFILLRLSHGTARFWTLANNGKENELEQIKF
ncbi:pyridoxamine 5'-phosphate oxidase family protein [Candidatus Desantisbacteria bacterium]|nr:pyridoxamine 5'-phosphate oxidase family protein [Candidatus Desantisbacteria bacterium]